MEAQVKSLKHYPELEARVRQHIEETEREANAAEATAANLREQVAVLTAKLKRSDADENRTLLDLDRMNERCAAFERYLKDERATSANLRAEVIAVEKRIEECENLRSQVAEVTRQRDGLRDRLTAEQIASANLRTQVAALIAESDAAISGHSQQADDLAQLLQADDLAQLLQTAERERANAVQLMEHAQGMFQRLAVEYAKLIVD
jgi:predicted  nucleic acid-binding Zn-ribbon protein